MAGNIFQQYIHPVRSVADYRADNDKRALLGLQLQGQIGQNEFVALTRQQAIERANQDQADRNAIRQAVASAGSPDAVADALDRTGLGAAMALADQRRQAAAKIAKDKADAAKTANETVDGVLKQFQTVHDRYVSNPDQAVTLLQAQYSHPVLGPLMQQMGPLDQQIAAIPRDPAKFQAYMQQSSLGMGKVAEMVAKQREADQKDATTRRGQDMTAQSAAAGHQISARLQGKAPPGYLWGPTDASGQPTMVAAKGGPADLKLAGQLNQDTQALTGATSGLDRLAVAANEALQHPGLKSTYGLRGMVPNIPGTDAADAAALLNTLKSQVGFSVLQDMRNNSKTGGALGQVSDKENAMLQANLAALEKAQSFEQAQKSLKKIIDYADAAKGRLRDAYNLKHGENSASPATPEAAAVAGKPGAKTVVRTGTQNGRKVVEYTDGTIEYVD
jgi:hypothetical protein